MFTTRQLATTILATRQWYPVLYVGGPRQSGKTTLLRHLFPDMPYTSLEDPDTRLLAEDDPRRFLNSFPKGGILDEAQRVPSLFSYLQTMVDANKSLQFILSGSQNFLLMEKISQSLAGRVGILNLYPFSYPEITEAVGMRPDLQSFAWQGGYPALYDKKIPSEVFFNNYLETYLERDVRLLKNVGDLSQFARFMRLCAGRVGQPLNMSTLATDTGVSVNTIKAWISVMEASYILYLLQPWHVNYNKRIIKSPKMYFFDTGLLCHLLGVSSPKQLGTHHFQGNIIENAIITELYKKRSNLGKRPVFWFWQDSKGNEVDLLIEEEGELRPIEIKSSQTYNPRLVSGLNLWQKLTDTKPEDQFLVYAGTQKIQLENCRLMPWQEAIEVL